MPSKAENTLDKLLGTLFLFHFREIYVSNIPKLLKELYNLDCTIPTEFQHLALCRYDFAVPLGDSLCFIEFDGINHFEFTPRYDKTPSAFLERVERDVNKTKLVMSLPHCKLLRISAYCDNWQQCITNFVMNDNNSVSFSDSEVYSCVWKDRLTCYPSTNLRQAFFDYDHEQHKIINAYRVYNR